MKTSVRDIFLLAGDLAMLVGSFFIMLNLAFPGTVSQAVYESHQGPFTAVGAVWVFVFFLFNLYQPHSIKPTIPNLQTIGAASLVSLAASAILFYSIPAFGITPKTNLVIFGMVFVILFIFWRRIFYAIFAKNFKKNVAFITVSEKDGIYATELIKYIQSYPQSGFAVAATYKSLKDFLGTSQPGRIDTLIVSKNALDGENLKIVYNSAGNILSLSQAYEDILGKVPIDSIDEAWFLHNLRARGNATYEFLARIVNFVIAFVLFIVALPFIIITAIAIKLSDGGPVFYNGLRVGKSGRNFKLYKFRSMKTGSENGKEWTEKDDPRITPVGKIIRRLHIDEAPQLLNVLRGELALVGPRPEIPSFAEKLERDIPHYNLRHVITPGFTGWAQIKWRNARGVAESKEKFEYDLYYIKNRNIFMDLGIILRTVIIIFTHN